VRSINYLVRTALLAGIGLTLAACAAAPGPYGDYGPSDYYGYDRPSVYGAFDFDYGGGRDGRRDEEHHDGHFAHGREGFGHGFGHGVVHSGGGGHGGGGGHHG
jgi:hypothetical protein